MNKLCCKRIYETPAETDGFRILVDRLWPRGIKKEKADINLWAKEIAPSNELRKWFSHDPEKYDEFKELYTNELNSNPQSQKFKDLYLQKIKDLNVTLLYAAKDEKYNNAVVLKDWLDE
ncbi:hypothetical protein HMPREF9225_0618 [Peptoniphilus duerdenii ATCC BAA-1640]|uniref:Uncharacterized protein n=1 Tax=Peptoniphilus duerdenii ATCC BAA-1640 TaxID=862517 RepID=E0NKC9_9FIRM|nr:DUF488 domain-containing protein [Peptoniphilus duerdenii]EFM25736.1 hypothetical protein HMPREF9225_0618 [Peptoniphilus duerdenii ATCC BAA-1640]